MDSQPCQLHVAFFPFLAHGHLIPTLDMARIFARQGVKVTIITTPLNAALFTKTIERDCQQGYEICILTIKFPAAEVGLPGDCENTSRINSSDMTLKFYKATSLLQQPLEHLVQECKPNCLVADMMFPWATEVAVKFGIPRLVVHGMSAFALCVFDSLTRYEPQETVESDFDPFTVPGLPHQIQLTGQQLPPFIKGKNEQRELADQIFQSDVKSYGVLLNSFQELEPEYSQHYRKVMGRKAWHIGPVSLCNQDIVDIAHRGDTASIDERECLRWLATKKPNSVLYICFGSMFSFSGDQIQEIAMTLEASEHNFIWVVKKEEKLPEGFEEQIEGKGLIIRGWAPQVLILDHEAIGGFITHCGWNSILEGVTAGVPMVTWPRQAEQFFNEKLVTDILKIGVGVGAQEWARTENKFLLRKEEIEKAVNKLMGGEESEELRNRSKILRDMARRAVEEGGSSHSHLKAFLEELTLTVEKREMVPPWK